MINEHTNPIKQKRIRTAIDESYGYTDLNGASRITGLSSSALYKLTATGSLRHYKPTGKLLFKIAELIEWIEKSGS